MKTPAISAQPIISLVMAFCSLFLLQRCTDSPLAPSGAAIIEGRVVDSLSLRGVEGVLVRSASFPETASTDTEGKYSFEVDLSDSTTILVRLSFTESAHEAEFVNVAIKQGEITVVPDTRLTQVGGPNSASGFASNVVLVEIETSNIAIKGSGANETSNLTFEVRDSTGTPIDLAHSAKVCFLIASGPGGGEFVAPDSVQTDNNGRVRTTVNSGTIAGTVQIVAEILGLSVFSEPVPVAIHSTLPDAAHFSVVSESLNFPGFNIFGITNSITAFVGDKFSNPVPRGTAVQFQTSGGIIAGSATTDDLGRASASLLAANPKPQGIDFSSLRVTPPGSLPAYFAEPGFALVTAQTIDENQQFIYAETVVLFSGVTQIRGITPTTFDLGPDDSQDFSFTVSDQNNNPLAPGTTITIGANNGSVTGDSRVVLEDTQARGPGATEFSFRLTNSKPEDIEGTSTTVTISVTSPNGNRSADIVGAMRQN